MKSTRMRLLASVLPALAAGLLTTTPVFAQGGPPGSPHHGEMAPSPERSQPDPSLPPETAVIQVIDGAHAPLAGVKVTLTERFESVAEGNTQEQTSLVTGADGVARFDHLKTALRFSYGVSLDFHGAHYEVAPFRLTKSGHRIVTQVFEPTADPKEALIGMRGFVYAQLREDVFHFEVLYRVFNMGKKAWIPKDVGLTLPARNEAVETPPGTADGQFVAENGSVRLKGTFPPGQHDVRFTFNVPSRNQDRETFTIGTLPHLAELRVLADSAPGMSMDVPGFDPVEETIGPEEKKVFITRRLAKEGETHFGTVTVELGGLPVIGPTRWFFVLGAAILTLSALFSAFFRRHSDASDGDVRQRDEARELVLTDLVQLERAFQEEKIGPRTYEQAKRQLLDALSRLEQPGRLEQPSRLEQPAA